MKRQYIKALLFAALFLILLYLSPYVVFMNSKVICAKVKQEGSIRNRKVLVYFYKYKETVYKGSFDSSSGICMQLDCYTNDDCFEIEVSTLLPFMSRLKQRK